MEPDTLHKAHQGNGTLPKKTDQPRKPERKRAQQKIQRRR
nr:MAG TPA: hypothetical protein [Caudoviricetes sp.]